MQHTQKHNQHPTHLKNEDLFTRTKLGTPRTIATIITCIAITRQDILVSLEVLITNKPQNKKQEKQVIEAFRVTY